MSIARYPDTLRQQAIALSNQGKGYKAVARALGVPRDTVRSWVLRYRLTGRTESVQTTGQQRVLEEREALYASAREEYERTPLPLRTIAQKHGLNYFNFRNFLQQHHPESALLHSYAKRTAELQLTLFGRPFICSVLWKGYLPQFAGKLWTAQQFRIRGTGRAVPLFLHTKARAASAARVS